MPSVNFSPPALGQITDDSRYNERNGLAVSTLIANTFWNGIGVPANTLGVNGDWYFRVDSGAAGTRLYTKQAGAWVGTAA
jgi:hypothetical protein